MPNIRTSSKKKTSTKSTKVSSKARSVTAAGKRPVAAKPSAKPAAKPTAKLPAKAVRTAPTLGKPVAAASRSIAPQGKIAAKAPAITPGREKSHPPVVPVEDLPIRQTVEQALASLQYREGQFVVHPKYGLGQVERILERRLTTHTVPCVEISFSYQGMRLTIPVDQVERSGLRRPIGRREIDGIFKVLKGRATFDAKRRSAKRVVDYRKRLGQGDPTSLAEAVRDLGRLSLKKSLSYEERKILTTALRILSREVALARNREPDEVRQEIERIVYR